MPDYNDNLSDQLRTAMIRSGKKMRDFCAATGLSESQISRFVNGKSNVSLTNADRLAASLSLTLQARGPEEISV